MTSLSTAQARTKSWSAFWAQCGPQDFSRKFPYKVMVLPLFVCGVVADFVGVDRPVGGLLVAASGFRTAVLVAATAHDVLRRGRTWRHCEVPCRCCNGATTVADGGRPVLEPRTSQQQCWRCSRTRPSRPFTAVSLYRTEERQRSCWRSLCRKRPSRPTGWQGGRRSREVRRHREPGWWRRPLGGRGGAPSRPSSAVVKRTSWTRCLAKSFNLLPASRTGFRKGLGGVTFDFWWGIELKTQIVWKLVWRSWEKRDTPPAKTKTKTQW